MNVVDACSFFCRLVSQLFSLFSSACFLSLFSCSQLTMASTLLPDFDHEKGRYPFCVVWTPIPLLTWIFPFIGHMGIAYSNGIIRDFAGPYFVSVNLCLVISLVISVLYCL